MKHYTIKVLLETKNTVYRDLLLSENDSLEEVHNSIKTAFDFNGNQLSSFIKESDGWQANEEYTLELIDDTSRKLMKDTKVSDVFSEEGEQLLYIYDYVNEWKFHLEVIEIESSNENIDTPSILKSHGKAPQENEKELSGADAESILMQAILGDEFEEDGEDDFDDPFESGDYDSLDDYEEYQ